MDEEKKMTVNEVAELLGYKADTIQKVARRLENEGMIGRIEIRSDFSKALLLNKDQIQEIKNNLAPRTLANVRQLANVSTDLEMIQKAQDFMAWATIKIKEETERRIAAEEKIQIDAPKVDFYITVTDSKDTIDIGTVAKVLNLPYGRNTLFSILRGKDILMANNQPYQEFMNRGYFKIVEEPYKKNGETFIGFKTVVFQKGLEYIKKVVSE